MLYVGIILGILNAVFVVSNAIYGNWGSMMVAFLGVLASVAIVYKARYPDDGGE